MPPVRPSQLHLAEACSLAPELAARFPTSSAAAEEGRAVHAEIARALTTGTEPETPRAREAVAYLRGLLVEGARLHVEEPVSLLDPGTGELVTEGTPDAQVGRPDGTLITIDWKDGRQAGLPDPESSLQLHSYSLARAIADGYKRYELVYVRLDPFLVLPSRVFERHDWWEPLRRIQRIVARPVAATMGPHCFDCWSRTHCPEYILPAHEGPTALGPFLAPGGLTSENAPRALLTVQAMKDVVELAEQVLKNYARDNGGIASEDGTKVWAPIEVAGRKTADVEALERDGLHQYVRTGGNFRRFSWRKR